MPSQRINTSIAEHMTLSTGAIPNNVDNTLDGANRDNTKSVLALVVLHPGQLREWTNRVESASSGVEGWNGNVQQADSGRQHWLGERLRGRLRAREGVRAAQRPQSGGGVARELFRRG